ncbi:MAG TPA: CBS domain-containing protein [Burkholderiaceae bacterium]|nr:CBS domain-containing protein [Burkholderiaceae bacterium]
MKVGTVASRVVITAPRNMPVASAARLMREHHLGTLVVIDESGSTVQPVGLVTDRDFMMEVLAQGVDPDVVTVGDLLSRPLVTVAEEASLVEAIHLMNRNGIRRLVVVDAAGNLAALLSMDDIVGVLAEELTGISQAIESEQRTERRQRPATDRRAMRSEVRT